MGITQCEKNACVLFWYQHQAHGNKTLGLMITPKQNACVSFALSNTHLKMNGEGADIDKIREIPLLMYLLISRDLM